jgi:plastocyanin
MRKLVLAIALLALAPFALAACGGDDDSSDDATTTEASADGTIAITADPDGSLAYEEKSIEAPAGELTIEFDNPAAIGHDVVVETTEGEELARTDVIQQDTATTTAELEPGEYTFYCSVAAHRDAGMEGPLTVE